MPEFNNPDYFGIWFNRDGDYSLFLMNLSKKVPFAGSVFRIAGEIKDKSGPASFNGEISAKRLEFSYHKEIGQGARMEIKYVGKRDFTVKKPLERFKGTYNGYRTMAHRDFTGVFFAETYVKGLKDIMPSSSVSDALLSLGLIELSQE